MRRLRPLLLFFIAVVAVLAPAARASEIQQSVMQDDDLLLYSDPATRLNTLQRMHDLGADSVRVTVLWRVVAGGVDPSSPAFVATDPATYPQPDWDRYDDLVLDAQRVGLSVYFAVTGPGPAWGHRVAPASNRRDQATWKPKAKLYGQFVTAVGRRYDGSYRDENESHAILPRVTTWSLWNEPNQAGWLTPQWERKGRHHVPTPTSPGLYRSLYRAGYAALEATGHANDVILLGETAPTGTNRHDSRGSIRPGRFLRELFCVSPHGRPYRGAAAARRNCAAVHKGGRLQATGYAHHPYTKKLSPMRRPPSRDDLSMGNIYQLPALLDRLSRATRALPYGMELFLTEFGYESRPPDPFAGVSLATQARWMQIGEFQAYENRRIRSQSQFLLRDAGPRLDHTPGGKAYWSTYQSGLYFADDSPKPAATAYSFPFLAYRGGGRSVRFWGQLRFRPNGADDSAQVQWQRNSKSPFRNLGPLVSTNPRGYFNLTTVRPGPGGVYRAVYIDAGGATTASLPTKLLRHRP